MLRKTLTLCAAVIMVGAFSPAYAVEIGEQAPEIEATDINGNAFKLSDHKGKIVVLEWTNKDCPFVRKHYESGNMQKTQKEATAMDGVEWISIISSAKGNQGHLSAEEAKEVIMDVGAHPTTQILDESGEIGKTYSAKTTPHMYVIDTDGTLAYMGAIDSNSSPNPATIEGATNYVSEALTALKAGEEVKTTSTAPYGCGVKYGS